MDVVDGKIVSAGGDRSSETWNTSTSTATGSTSTSSSTCDPSICELADESIITTPPPGSGNYVINTPPPGWAASSWRMTPTPGGQVNSCGEYYFNNHPGSSMYSTGLSNCKMQVAGRHPPPASGMMSMNMPSTTLSDVFNPSDYRWGAVATPAGAFFVEEPAAGAEAGAEAGGRGEYHSNTLHNNNNFVRSSGGQYHQRLNPNGLVPPLSLPGKDDGGDHHHHHDAHVMDHGMATMLRMIPCDSGASFRPPTVQTHIPIRRCGGHGGRVEGQDLDAVATQFHLHHTRRPRGYHGLYHLHQRRHHQHQHHQQPQQCQAVDHRPPNPATSFDQEMRMFESQIAQTASRNIKRLPPPHPHSPSPSPLLLPNRAGHGAERLVSPPLSPAEHADDHHLPLQGASKSGGSSKGPPLEILQGAGSDVQQDTRIMSSTVSKMAADHLPSSISQISTQTHGAAVVVPAPLEKAINIGPVGGTAGTGSASAGKKGVLSLSPVCELSELMCLSGSNSQQQSCGLPSPGAGHDHKRKISEPIEDQVSTWNEPLRFLVRKGLTLSDCGELGRVVLPKKDVEAQFPRIESKDGVLLTMTDYDTMKQWLFRYKWWLNNKSRMYVLENTGEFIKYHDLKENDTMLVYEDASCNLVIRGEKNLNREPYHVPHQQNFKSQSHPERCKAIPKVTAAPVGASQPVYLKKA